MATQNLGRVKIVWKGDYSSNTAYVVDDAVFYEGSSYICKQNATAKIPTNTNYWDKMASKGNSGAVPAIGMSATVDGTSSATPSVTVTEGGTALQPTFELAFSGLKGAKGDKGDKGDTGDVSQAQLDAAVATLFPRSEQAVLGAKNIGEYNNYSLLGDENNGYNVASGGCSLLAKLTHNKDYVAQKKSGQGDRFRVVLFNNLPSTTPDHTAYQVIFDNSKTEVSFNSGNYNYAVYTYVSSNGTVVSQDTAEAMVSFDGGEYAPYAMTNRELTDNILKDVPMSVTAPSRVLDMQTGSFDLNNVPLGVSFTSNSNATNISHKPSEVTGSFTVYTLEQFEGFRYQIMILRDNPSAVFRRSRNDSNTWESWYKFTGTSVQ